MIASNSRYLQSTLTTINVNGRDIVYILPSAPVTQTFQFSNYSVKTSDRIDNIAAAFLGDPTQWFLIARANPEILTWDNISSGTLIRIPIVTVLS